MTTHSEPAHVQPVSVGIWCIPLFAQTVDMNAVDQQRSIPESEHHIGCHCEKTAIGCPQNIVKRGAQNFGAQNFVAYGTYYCQSLIHARTYHELAFC